MVDLGRWLDGDYRIPGEPASDIVASDMPSGSDDGAPWPGPDNH